MFTRSMFSTDDIEQQGRCSTRSPTSSMRARFAPRWRSSYGRINAENLKRAHALLESNRARGKIVLEGFGA